MFNFGESLPMLQLQVCRRVRSHNCDHASVYRVIDEAADLPHLNEVAIFLEERYAKSTATSRLPFRD
jgi:hypothetical protein